MKNGLRLVFLLAVLALAVGSGTTAADGGIWCGPYFYPCSMFDEQGCYYTYDSETDCCRLFSGPFNCITYMCCA